MNDLVTVKLLNSEGNIHIRLHKIAAVEEGVVTNALTGTTLSEGSSIRIDGGDIIESSEPVAMVLQKMDEAEQRIRDALRSTMLYGTPGMFPAQPSFGQASPEQVAKMRIHDNETMRFPTKEYPFRYEHKRALDEVHQIKSPNFSLDFSGVETRVAAAMAEQEGWLEGFPPPGSSISLLVKNLPLLRHSKPHNRECVAKCVSDKLLEHSLEYRDKVIKDIQDVDTELAGLVTKALRDHYDGK
jgi:hypothetical protein